MCLFSSLLSLHTYVHAMHRLKDKESEFKVEKALNDRFQQTIDNQALQISKLKLEVERLQGELDAATTAANARGVVTSAAVASEDVVATSEREEFLMSPPPPPPPVPTPPAVASRERRSASPSPPALQQPLSLTSDGDLRPVSALSEEDIQIHENGVSGDESEKDDEAFEKTVPSPVAPCPYIDFVPLPMDRAGKDKAGKTKGGVSSGSVKGVESGKDAEEPAGGVKKGEESGKDGEEPAGDEKGEEPIVNGEAEDSSAVSEKKALPSEDKDSEEADGEGKDEKVCEEGQFVCIVSLFL